MTYIFCFFVYACVTGLGRVNSWASDMSRSEHPEVRGDSGVLGFERRGSSSGVVLSGRPRWRDEGLASRRLFGRDRKWVSRLAVMRMGESRRNGKRGHKGNGKGSRWLTYAPGSIGGQEARASTDDRRTDNEISRPRNYIRSSDAVATASQQRHSMPFPRMAILSGLSLLFPSPSPCPIRPVSHLQPPVSVARIDDLAILECRPAYLPEHRCPMEWCGTGGFLRSGVVLTLEGRLKQR